ncbi:MAG: hypothetical protein WCT53_02000 [Candidatus Gracilibacteria bacterium]
MLPKLVVQKTLMPGIPSAKAYQLIFSDEAAYLIFLGRDWGGYGGSNASVLGKMVVAAAGAVSHNKIAEKLEEIKDEEVEKLVSDDPKNSVKIPYGELKEFKNKAKNWWSGDAFVLFKTSGGKYKFTFTEEEPRESIVELIKQKRPDLIGSLAKGH